VFHGRLVPDPTAAARVRGQPVLAFAGIGRPEKFFDTLAQCGADVVDARAFADHHPYKPDEIEALQAQARNRGLHLVTTEKDAARLAGSPALQAALQGALTLPVHLQVDDPDRLRALLAQALATGRRQD
jgi:tetraacyldisaccharide 4'-kinase